MAGTRGWLGDLVRLDGPVCRVEPGWRSHGRGFAAVPVVAQGQHPGAADRGPDAYRGAVARLLLRGVHDVSRADDGNLGDVVFVWSGGVLSICGSLEEV